MAGSKDGVLISENLISYIANAARRAAFVIGVFMKKKIAPVLRLFPVLAADAAMVFFEWRSLLKIWNGSGKRMFIYYTQDSNILAMVVCAISVIGTLVCLIMGKEKRPDWIRRIKHVAASCLAVTLIVEMCVLVPMNCRRLSDFPREFRYGMLSGEMLYMHTVCPLLMIFSFLILEPGKRMKGNVYVCLIPTLIYGVVSLYMNYIRAYIGPYPFLYVYIQPVYMTVIWMILIFGGAGLIALGLAAINSYIGRRCAKNN